MTDSSLPSTAALWARFRFSVVGSLLSSPPARGELNSAIQFLAAKTWIHPISGRRVRYAGVTIECWYYKARCEKDDPLRGLQRAVRRDCGKVSLAPALAEYLLNQYRDHPQWTYQLHYDNLAALLRNDPSRGPLSSYSTVRRYMKTHGLVPKPQPEKLAKQIRSILPSEKEMLEQWRRSSNMRLWQRAVTFLDSYHSTIEEICAKIERSQPTVLRWVRAFNDRGIEGIIRQSRDRAESDRLLEVKRKRIFEILHARPKSFGVNRSNWTRESLAKAYVKRHGEAISAATVGRLIRRAGYRLKTARRVLTSPDPDYREKVELVLRTLQSLNPNELFFFVDELGPLRVRRYGGRCYVPKKAVPTYMETRTYKGSITLIGALSATTNQMTWFYGKSKDTGAMIDLTEILFNQHHDKSRLYITWDAASWHGSEALTSWLDVFNAQTREISGGPIIEFVPLPSRSQFLDVIESAFSAMKRAVIHHSDYSSEYETKSAISTHYVERNEHFEQNPRRAGKTIWEIDFFNDFTNLRAGDYREW